MSSAKFNLSYGQAILETFMDEKIHTRIEYTEDLLSLDEFSIYLNCLLPTIKSIETILNEINLLSNLDNGNELPVFVDLNLLSTEYLGEDLTNYLLELIHSCNKNEIAFELYSLLRQMVDKFIRELEPMLNDVIALLDNNINVMIQIPRFIEFDYFERLTFLFHGIFVEEQVDFIRIQILTGEGIEAKVESIYYYPEYGYITT